MTTGLVKTNLSVFNDSISMGYSTEDSLNTMIESRYINNPLHSHDRQVYIIGKLKGIVSSQIDTVKTEKIIINVLTKIYETENPNLPNKIILRHKKKIINTINKQFNVDKKHNPQISDKMKKTDMNIVCPECGTIYFNLDFLCPECGYKYGKNNPEKINLEQDFIEDTKYLCSKLFDIIYSPDLNIDLNAVDAVSLLSCSYCLSLFSRIGFSNDDGLLEQFIESKNIKTNLSNWLNDVLAGERKKEYYDSGLDEVANRLVNNFPNIYDGFIKDLNNNLKLADEIYDDEMVKNLKNSNYVFLSNRLLAASATILNVIKSILNRYIGVTDSVPDKINRDIYNILIEFSFEIAGIEK